MSSPLPWLPHRVTAFIKCPHSSGQSVASSSLRDYTKPRIIPISDMATASSPVNISVFHSPESKPMPCSAVTSASSAKCFAPTAKTAFSLPPLPITSVM